MVGVSMCLVRAALPGTISLDWKPTLCHSAGHCVQWLWGNWTERWQSCCSAWTLCAWEQTLCSGSVLCKGLLYPFILLTRPLSLYILKGMTYYRWSEPCQVFILPNHGKNVFSLESYPDNLRRGEGEGTWLGDVIAAWQSLLLVIVTWVNSR